MGGSPNVPREIIREGLLIELAKRRGREAVQMSVDEFRDATFYGYALGGHSRPSGVVLMTGRKRT